VKYMDATFCVVLSVFHQMFTVLVPCAAHPLPRPTMSVGMGRIFDSVCLSVCPKHNSKKNDPKVFKLGVGNDLGIP